MKISPFFTKKNLVASIIFVILGTFFFTVLRHLITFGGAWIVTFSTKKLFVYLCILITLNSILIFVKAKRLIILSSILLSVWGWISATNDFYYLRSDGNYAKNVNKYAYLNNYFLNEKQNVRLLKKKSLSPEDFWSKICKNYAEICNVEKPFSKRVEGAMLLASNFFDFGDPQNLGITINSSGCVGKSIETNFQGKQIKWGIYSRSDIGCCTDYAYLLASFFNYLNIDNEFVLMPGHIANRAKENSGEWIYLDANTNIIIHNLFNDKTKFFQIYPHGNVNSNEPLSTRNNVYNFQKDQISRFSSKVHYLYNYFKFEETKNIDNYLKGI